VSLATAGTTDSVSVNANTKPMTAFIVLSCGSLLLHVI
jgi:hypothetical protein